MSACTAPVTTRGPRQKRICSITSSRSTTANGSTRLSATSRPLSSWQTGSALRMSRSGRHNAEGLEDEKQREAQIDGEKLGQNPQRALSPHVASGLYSWTSSVKSNPTAAHPDNPRPTVATITSTFEIGIRRLTTSRPHDKHFQYWKHVHKAINNCPMSFDKIRCVRQRVRLRLVMVDAHSAAVVIAHCRPF